MAHFLAGFAKNAATLGAPTTSGAPSAFAFAAGLELPDADAAFEEGCPALVGAACPLAARVFSEVLANAITSVFICAKAWPISSMEGAV